MTPDQSLKTHSKRILEHLYCSPRIWKYYAMRIAKREAQNKPLSAEGTWTFLLSCSYAMVGQKGIEKLTTILTGAVQPQPTSPKIWLEGFGIEPRSGEGQTRVDLALGAVQREGSTDSGIEFDNRKASWICFCEMKWNSDISAGVKNDAKRNQLARDIENALCFQNHGTYPELVYFTVVAPTSFARRRPLLLPKFAEYNGNRDSLIKDLSECILEKNRRANWRYPNDIENRVRNALRLRWVEFAELINNLPESEVSDDTRTLWTMEKAT
jgi:hypothetical protein